MLKKTVRLNALFDFYHILLTSKQREYLQLYYLEDYTLAEIAEFYHISRQAVYDNIKRTEVILESYEDKLQLYKKHKQRLEVIEELQQTVQKMDQNELFSHLIQQLYDVS